ncbi:MAG: hypothetical protein QOF78_1485 [Phycisphaerales bacterium]|jgi:Flp pilus assembly protein TadD|nr:hypothetical protein [Phycisphaerales bacterium]
MTRDTLLCLALGCLTLLLFAPVHEHEFINYDDPGYVFEPHVRRGLTLDNVQWAFTTTHFANYHPLTWLSHMADVSMFGHKPAGHHLVSVALHSINAVLLYLVLRAMTGYRSASFAVAAIWAVHPLRVESVAWVAERKDLLSGLFFLLALGCYTRYARRGSVGAYVGSLVCFALGLMSKPMLVTVPCVLFLLDCWPLKRPAPWKKLVVEKVPFFVLSIASAILTVIAQRQGGAMRDGEGYPLTLRLGNALWSYARYVELSFWPRGLAIIYPYRGALPGTHLPLIGVAAGAAILIGMTAVGVYLWRRERAVLVGWLWFIGMLVPVIGIVQVGWQSMADRYTYLPQIGLLIAVIWLARMFLAPLARGHVIATAMMVVVVAGLSLRTHLELRHWRNNVTLFTRALAVTDKNHIAHSALGLALGESNIPAAIDQYKQAIEITPKDPQLYYNIGRLYLIQGNLPLAESWFQDTLAFDPKYVDALINLSKALSGMGRHAEAMTSLRQALEIDPDNAVAHYDLAVELAERGKVKEALPHFAEAIRLEPNVPELHYSYSVALRQTGQADEADLAYKRYSELARQQGAKPLPMRATNPDNRSGQP